MRIPVISFVIAFASVMTWQDLALGQKGDPDVGSGSEISESTSRASSLSGHIYWTAQDTTGGSFGNAIFRYSLARASIDTVVSSDSYDPAGVAADTLSGKIYWTDNGALPSFRVMRADSDGDNIEEVVNVGGCGIAGLTDIELDLIGGQMYWGVNGDCGGVDLMRADLDGSDLEYDLMKPPGILEHPDYIALDPFNRFIYWDVSSTAPNGIGRVAFDGTGLESVIVDHRCSGLELDPESQKMYWALGSSIHRSALREVRVETLLTSLGDPRDVALDLAGEKIYWVETEAGAIRRANLDGSDPEDLLRGLHRPVRLTLDFGGKVFVANEEPGNLGPRELNLRNYPNPFESATRFTFQLPSPAEAKLEVYDILGRRVARVASRLFAAGTSSVEWNAEGLGKGLYFGRLSSRGHFATIPLIVQ